MTACATAFLITIPARALRAQERPATADSLLRAALHGAVRRFSPELAARRAELEAAEARLRATGFAPAMVLAAEVEEVPNGLDLGDAGSVRLDLQREFLSGGRRSASRALARSEVARAAAALYATERRLLAVADQRLTQAVGWAAIARRLAAEDSLLTAAEGGLRARFAVGDARYVDVLRLRTERLRVGSERAAALTEARVSRRGLVALAAAHDSVAVRVTALVDSTIIAGGAMLLAGTLSPAPDLDSLIVASGAARLADAEVERAQAARRLVLAEQRPRLVASLGAQRFTTDAGGSTVGPTVGASISLPFTARRANATAAQAAAHEVTAAEAERRATLVAVRADLAAARDRYEAARARLAVYEAALLTGAREERESALASYRSGELSLIELLDFERALARAEIDQLRSRIDAAGALADLFAGAVPASEPAHEETVLRAPRGDR